MKKAILLAVSLVMTGVAWAQGPGLIISEVMANPAGTDSPFEYIEFVATKSIDFSLTPYSVVVTNNGTATAQGWIAGGSITYGFEITSGTVVQGDVVYVGGSTMAPTGTKLRIINTGTTNGDGFGVFNASGVVGNGGANCDAVAVFPFAITSLTNASRPDDALFFGTGTGTAVVSGGTAGYELPFNDIYSGGKLQSTSFLAPDPTSGNALIATGVFNPSTGSFTSTRSFALGSSTDLTTAITFGTGSGNVQFSIASTNQTVSENAGTASFNINISNPNSAQAIVNVTLSSLSNAENVNDFGYNSIITVPAGSTATQTVNFTIIDDATLESDEYLVLSLLPLTNASITGSNLHALYIRDNDNPSPMESNELVFNLLGSYQNGAEGSNSAEIVSHDPTVQRLYVANSIGAKLDILNFSNPAAISSVASIPMLPTYGNINSVAAYNGIVAVANESLISPQDSGRVNFFDANGTFINSVKVGMLPDMITFSHNGQKVIVACEGEPNASYTNDPQGSICVIDISGGVASLTQSNVTGIGFTAFNGQEASLRAMGIRIYGPGANASMDFEPEYVTLSDDDQIAWVSLQENNALAVIDLTTNTVTQLLPLGYKDLNQVGNALDISDQTSGINLSNFPIKAMTLPDALSHFSVGGTDYILTANEGDARAYAGFNEESRISSGAIVLDPTVFPNGSQLKSNVLAGRLTVSNIMGDTDSDGDKDELYMLGGRSFSIYNGNTGALVFDSGDDFERIISTHPTYASLFNASNTSGAAVSKNRSDDKGPECEGVSVALINGEYFAFASLERVGGVMIYNVTDPMNVKYVGYHNNRSFVTNGPDRGAEGMIYIDAASSPNGNSILLLANEISSSITVFQMNTCSSISGVNLLSNDTTAFCSGDSVTLYTPFNSGINYQWYENGSVMVGETDSTITVMNTGNFALYFDNPTQSCFDSISISTIVNPVPSVTANASASTLCENDSLTLSGSGADAYLWDNGVTDAVEFPATTTTTYTVIGENSFGCADTASITVNVNILPSVNANASSSAICMGDTVNLTGSGADSYLWNNGVIDGNDFVPSSSLYYTVTGTDLNGCSSLDSVLVAVNPLPTPSINFTGTDLSTGVYSTIQWFLNGNPIAGATSAVYTPTTNGQYTVIVSNPFGCEDTSAIYNLTTLSVQGINSTTYSVYPNPFTTEVNIKGSFDNNTMVTITNSIGETVFQKNNFDGSVIRMNNLPQGMYVLTIMDPNSLTRFTILKK